MDYNSQWQQPPEPTMQPPEMNMSTLADAYYASYYGYYANPDPNHQNHGESLAFAIPPPPGVVGPTAATATSDVTVETTPYYIVDTNVQNWAWREAIHMYGTDPLAIAGPDPTGQPNSIYPSDISWTSYVVQSQLPEVKKPSKKGKVVQSAYCEVCKVYCNGPSVIEQHILGKKHLKNLEKLKPCLLSSNTASSLSGPTIPVPLIGPQEKPCKSKARKKGVESTPEDLETESR